MNVQDNQFVRKGDLLFQIDPRPYEYALQQARAEQATLESQIEDERRRIAAERSAVGAARAGVSGSQSNISAAQGAYLAAKAAVERARAAQDSAEAQLKFAQNDYERIALSPGSVPPARLRRQEIASSALPWEYWSCGLSFDQIWPTRPSDALDSIRGRVQNNLKRLSTQSLSREMLSAMRAEVSSDLAQMQNLISSAWFDFSADQHRELARSRRITCQTEAAAAEFYSHLHQLRQNPSPSG